MWIDAHTHLEMLELNTDEVLSEAHKAGVERMITIGCHPNDFPKVCTIAKAKYPVVAATLGVHPHEAKFYTDEVETQIRNEAQNEFIIGIGEIGLDYYYNHSDPAVQRMTFERQVQLAYDLKLPVQIHTREAEDDTIAVLQKWKGKISGMLHCFTGTQKLASAALDCGFFISLSGVVTFKNSDALREVVRHVPVDRILVETDAPFLAPVPMRGKKNVPAFMVHTAHVVAGLKNVSSESLSETVQKNVKTLFPKWKF